MTDYEDLPEWRQRCWDATHTTDAGIDEDVKRIVQNPLVLVAVITLAVIASPFVVVYHWIKRRLS